MRALTLIADRKLELTDGPAPPPPGRDEVQVRVKAVGLNHLDLWGYGAWPSPGARCPSS